MAVKPPRPRGPHLNAMRCFEAAARLGGFSAAADELSVTPGAVSQQIKALEDWVGAPLFERRSQGVKLTPLGARVCAEFTAAFDSLGDALHGLRQEAAQGAVNIAALPSVAQLWLSPRLPDVRRAFPHSVISITALEKPPNLRREVFDVSLFFGVPSGRATERVVSDDLIFPVCTPEIAARLRHPSDLAGEVLIHDATWKEDWNQWLEAAAVQGVSAGEAPVFSLYSIAVDEARNGAGVLMGHGALVERYLASGELVAPFATMVRSGKSLILETATARLPAGPLRQIVEMLAR